nr:MAG TPA: hypothetical protein [Bacteriophage sp.]
MSRTSNFFCDFFIKESFIVHIQNFYNIFFC